MPNLKKHFWYYLSLLSIFGVSFTTLYFSQDRFFQLTVLTITVFFYIIWGVLHHHLHHDLSAKIVVEYVLMGALGEALIFLIFKGGFGL